MKSKALSGEGRFAYEGLDRVIHERARLSILTCSADASAAAWPLTISNSSAR